MYKSKNVLYKLYSLHEDNAPRHRTKKKNSQDTIHIYTRLCHHTNLPPIQPPPPKYKNHSNADNPVKLT